MGALFAFVLWVLAIALIYALVQSQAQSGALAGVARVSALRAVVFAGESAVEEASYVIRNPSGESSGVLDAMQGGGTRGNAPEPETTRALFKHLKDENQLGGDITIGPVTYELVRKGQLPAGTPENSGIKPPWLVDLAVKVDYVAGPIKLARTVRRRYVAYEVKVVETMGPKAGTVVARSLFMRPEVLLEVVE